MTLIPTLPPPRPAVDLPTFVHKDTKLREAAVALEASFLAEMLKSTGFGEGTTSFGGGIGEEQFASFLADAQAKELAKAGGIGLAEAIFEALKIQGVNDVAD
ncbi:rod-binding protein [Yoonia litorea]|uniref:Rod binding protein n=1 Tax=Yoonia litorea TaxID=1123755 RepID=A0A1I6MU47_9RHOB|nr:rod-binding protein [Yoonia litorea]SFS19174.1 Rod binding protein [Yoonia litorea]